MAASSNNVTAHQSSQIIIMKYH